MQRVEEHLQRDKKRTKTSTDRDPLPESVFMSSSFGGLLRIQWRVSNLDQAPRAVPEVTSELMTTADPSKLETLGLEATLKAAGGASFRDLHFLVRWHFLKMGN